jgi:hypothetical protein
VITNRVAATCAVCGKYVPVQTGVPVGDPAERRFRHAECGDHAAAAVRPPRRPADRWATDTGALGGLGARFAALPHPGLTALGGAVAVVLGVVLLFVASSGDNASSPVRRSSIGNASDVSVLGETETAAPDDGGDGATTTAGDGTTASSEDSGVGPLAPGAPVTTRRTAITRPGTTPPPGAPGEPTGTSVPGSPVTTKAPGTTGGSTTTRPGSTATTTTRPPTTTTRPPTTTAPPTTTQPPTTPPPTTPPPTTQPPPTTTQPPTTTSPPTTEPPTTEPPTTEPPTEPPPTEPPTTAAEDLLGAIGDLLDGLL